jgi:anti-sigma regulatory factor (Ser/Thr protein kinase)
VRDVRLDDSGIVLTLDNDIGEIAAALPHLEAFGAQVGLGARLQNRVEVVVEEVVSNAVRHGFSPGSAQRVRISARAEADRLVLVFEDDGQPFDPLAVRAPASLTDLASAPEGGLGIALLRRLAERVAYESPRSADGDFRPVNQLTVELAR